MAISSLNQVLSGMQSVQMVAKVSTPTMVAGRPQSLWGLAGIPGAGSYSSSLAGQANSSTSALVAGQIPHADPAGGVSAYLARFQSAVVGSAGLLLLCDRLWENGGFTITSTGSQTVNSVAFPARDNTGTVNGVGVYLGVEISAATGAGTPTITVGYTNSSGTASRTGTNADPTVASSAAGAFYRIGVQTGDVGVQSVQNLTLSATWTSGTMNMVAYRVLAIVEQTTTAISNAVDAVTGGLPQLFNGVVPFMIYVPNATTASVVIGHYIETQG